MYAAGFNSRVPNTSRWAKRCLTVKSPSKVQGLYHVGAFVCSTYCLAVRKPFLLSYSALPLVLEACGWSCPLVVFRFKNNDLAAEQHVQLFDIDVPSSTTLYPSRIVRLCVSQANIGLLLVLTLNRRLVRTQATGRTRVPPSGPDISSRTILSLPYFHPLL